eukprot:1827353-Rhodomonas_salina.1
MRQWQAVEKTEPPFSRRHAMGFANARDHLYLFGGDAGYLGAENDLHVFDPTSETWDSLSQALTSSAAGCRATYGMGFASVKNKLFSFGGYIWGSSIFSWPASFDLLDQLCIFDLEDMAWKDPNTVSGVRPTARAGVGLASAGDSLYLFGGFGGSDLYLKDLYLLDTTRMAWEALEMAASPSSRAFMGFASDGGMLYLFGGVDETGNTTNDLYMLDPSRRAWQELSQHVSGSIPSKRAYMGFTAAGGKLFVFGGMEIVGGPAVNSLHVLDPTVMVWEDLTSSFLGRPISARALMGFSSVGNKLFAVGGTGENHREGDDINFVGRMHVFDLSARNSADYSVSGIPSARSSFGFESVGGKLYMFGGRSHQEPFQNIINSGLFRFDQATWAWQDLSNVTLGSPPSPRYNMGFASSNNKIFVFGGGTTDRSTGYVNDLHVLDVSTLSWQELTHNTTGDAPIPRTDMAFAAVQDKLFVFGGNINIWQPQLYLGDFHMLDLSAMTWHNLEDRVTGAAPSPRAITKFTKADDGKLYLFGGRGRSGDVYNDLYVFDPVAMEWRDLTASTAGGTPLPRRGHAVAAGLGRLFVVGGHGAKGYLNDVQVLDLSARPMRWEDLSQATGSEDFLFAADKAGVAFIEGTLFHYGGWGLTKAGGWAYSDAFSSWTVSHRIRATWANTT